MDPTKTPIYAVCVTGKTVDRYAMAKKAIESFLLQNYPGVKKILVVTDNDPLYTGRPENAQIQQLCLPSRMFKLGELRNAAKDFIASAAGREKRPYQIVHWDDDDYSHPYRLTHQVLSTPPDSVSMFSSCLHANLLTGEAFIGDASTKRPFGYPATLMYPANSQELFTKVVKYEGHAFLDRCREREVKITYIRDRPELVTRFYDGRNNSSFAEFANPSGGCSEPDDFARKHAHSLMDKQYADIRRKLIDAAT